MGNKKEQTVVQEVNARMEEILAAQKAEMEKIQARLAEAREQQKAAEKAMEDATRKTDLDAYDAAKVTRDRAITTQEMLTARANQLSPREVITEEESNQIIGSLRQYNVDLNRSYREALFRIGEDLKQLQDAYSAKIASLDTTMGRWQREIRPNYSTFGQTTRIDPETGERTDRKETPNTVQAFTTNDTALVREFLERLRHVRHVR